MKSASGKDVCRALERKGWTLRRVHGSHHIYAQPGNPTIVTVPVHGHRDLRKGTLGRIMKDAGLTDADL